jgi:hypothetical protein
MTFFTTIFNPSNLKYFPHFHAVFRTVTEDEEEEEKEDEDEDEDEEGPDSCEVADPPSSSSSKPVRSIDATSSSSSKYFVLPTSLLSMFLLCKKKFI